MRTGLLTTAALVAVCGFGRAAEDHQQLATYALGSLGSAVGHFRMDVACHGGYLWRYKADMSEREGEGKATPMQIWVQPPGTPSVGLAMLEAYELTGMDLCRDGAIEAARALVWGQLACGGWDYLVDFDPNSTRSPYYLRDKLAGVEPRRGQRTWAVFDDNTTQHALRLLMAVDRALKFEDKEIHEATLRGLQCVLDAQYPNGGWPQAWPLGEGAGYARDITFNDNAMNDCMSVMLEGYTTYNDERYFEAAKRGGDCIIALQLPEPQSGWGQQYDESLKPAPARWFEPAACEAAVTAGNMRTLMELFRATRDEKYLKPVPAATKWLEASKLDNGKWARFYEPGTNKPLYVNMDRQVVYVYDDTIRPGYSWQSGYGIPGAIAAYEALVEQVEAGTVGWTIPPPGKRPLTPEQARATLDRLAPEVRKVCDALDAEGNWVRKDGWLYCEDFIRNTRLLAQYINAATIAEKAE
jgi:PelA/Pel-15E family pectate lyase